MRGAAWDGRWAIVVETDTVQAQPGAGLPAAVAVAALVGMGAPLTLAAGSPAAPQGAFGSLDPSRFQFPVGWKRLAPLSSAPDDWMHESDPRSRIQSDAGCRMPDAGCESDPRSRAAADGAAAASASLCERSGAAGLLGSCEALALSGGYPAHMMRALNGLHDVPVLAPSGAAEPVGGHIGAGVRARLLERHLAPATWVVARVGLCGASSSVLGLLAALVATPTSARAARRTARWSVCGFGCSLRGAVAGSADALSGGLTRLLDGRTVRRLSPEHKPVGTCTRILAQLVRCCACVAGLSPF